MRFSTFTAIMVACVFSSLLTGSTACVAQGTATATATDSALRWKFQKGQKYRLEMKQDMTQNMMMQNQPIKTSNKTTTYMTWEVKDVDEAGTASIESIVERLTMSLNTPMGQFEIDTDKEDPPGVGAQMAASVRPLIGVTFKQKMDSRGRVSDVEIPEGALAGMQNQSPGLGMTADQLKEMSSKVSPVFPEDDLEIGETWNQTSQSKTPVGQIEIDNTYKYEGTTTVDDQLAHCIGITTTMNFPSEPNEMGMMIRVTDQDTTGTMYFDQQHGRMMKSEVEQDMTMNITAGGHDLVQQMNQKMTATFTDITGQ